MHIILCAVWLMVVVTAAHPPRGSYAAASCGDDTCAFGSLVSSNPFCLCSCEPYTGTDAEEAFSPPHCFYRARELQPLVLTLNTSLALRFNGPDTFNSALIVSSLCNATGITDESQCQRDVVVAGVKAGSTTYTEMIVCTVFVRSPFVVELLTQMYASSPMSVPKTNRNAWVAAVGLVAVSNSVPVPSCDRDDGTLKAIALGTVYSQEITLGSFVWVVASIVIVVVVCATDGLLFGVTLWSEKRRGHGGAGLRQSVADDEKGEEVVLVSNDPLCKAVEDPATVTVPVGESQPLAATALQSPLDDATTPDAGLNVAVAEEAGAKDINAAEGDGRQGLGADALSPLSRPSEPTEANTEAASTQMVHGDEPTSEHGDAKGDPHVADKEHVGEATNNVVNGGEATDAVSEGGIDV